MASKRFKNEVVDDKTKALVLVCMGSQSDWESTMRHACVVLEELNISFRVRILSAHRTPDRLHVAAGGAKDLYKVVIAGAGGAAHLPGMFAAKTRLPVIGVPVKSSALSGIDSLLSIVQMPPSTPVGTMAIGKAGAINAALYAVEILCLSCPELVPVYENYRAKLAGNVSNFPHDEPKKRN